jgi:hypothetical protein
MAQTLDGPKTIRIFLASPSDVEAERDALSALIQEVNDVLAFLVPDRALRLELVRYETHAYPDVAPDQSAQEVINRQIPIDYDIFVGVMWKRAGTPTKTAPSGTIEEFRRALAHRQNTGRPVIMFYFCDEQVPFPHDDDLLQLQQVVKFRDELDSIGYTLNYPSHATFRDHVRGGILRAVADLLGGGIKSAAALVAPLTSSASVADADRDEMARLASQYDEVRSTMSSGYARTQAMTRITAAMRMKAAAVRSLLGDYQASNSAGVRLAGIAVLHQFPDPSQLPWLVARLDPDKETPFVGYAAAVALAQAVRSLPASAYEALQKSLTDALALAKRNPHDPPRLNVLETALKELAAKHAPPM